MPRLLWIYQFVEAHEAFFFIVFAAWVYSMPSQLPENLYEFPQWAWGWFHDCLKLFLNYRAPAVPGPNSSSPSGQKAGQ